MAQNKSKTKSNGKNKSKKLTTSPVRTATLVKVGEVKALAKAYEKTHPRLKFATTWQYAPSPESTDHVKLEKKYDLFINGKFTEPQSGKYFETVNPATETKIADIAEANDKDVDAAVAAGRKAYDNVWSKMPPKERGKYISELPG